MVKKDETVKIALDSRKQNESCAKKTTYAKHGRTIKPNIR